MSLLPTYYEINVISDIHMGGEPGFQILRHGERLGALIEDLAQRSPDRDVALILNGDVIDSLAENIGGYVAMENGERMMDRIYSDPTFKPVWQGLGKFVRAPKRHLIIVAGNHDIELYLPGIERSIRQRLTGGESALNGIITFATHGTGYACCVGSARVYCTHGNEVDAWNHVDHRQLAELGNALSSGKTIEKEDWLPNGGTRLVVDVMNRIKHKYPFVDLLKPEIKLVVPILLVLKPELVKGIDFDDVFSIAAEWIRGKMKTRGLLSADAESSQYVSDPAAAAELALDELLGPQLCEGIRAGGLSPPASEDDLLLAAELAMDKNEDVLASIEEDAAEDTLGWFGMFVDRVRGVDKIEALRRAILDWVKDDGTFDIKHRDDCFEDIIKRVSDDVDFVITGHTHLERAIKIRGDVDRFYYNSGTWIRLLRLKTTLLKEDVFPKVYEILKSDSMRAIDEGAVDVGEEHVQPLVLDQTSLVRIAVCDEGVKGELLHIRGGEAGDELDPQPVPNSTFVKELGVKKL
ncbi:MAG: hypothetical protein GY774_00705 [Planctomycetes bacterium]|nr:hypothetical protein [Planctomycetota bacterium]